MILFSDRGTPDGYHHMNGYSGHTFKFVNKEGKFNYVQIHIRKDGGFKTLTDAQATKLAGENPEYGIESLFKDIEKGNFPSWTVYVLWDTLYGPAKPVGAPWACSRAKPQHLVGP